ncbi:hypothetical protein D187_009796 [Cystobacter fuscus DSM 2262]|uniref:Uncharacterized protein n=1 Tax=Cystobacter fuscus (strain ATCC 25194 / DSM 2262 / NBRC 100088 / M29) TaxID=1242864 RepID=S9P5M2_CYSF2|nr:M4 family metallopeptidase [Cystobacter fuscus]EPX57522.1 hypothetical protein D187_009796 [Cystobacter fuscus DSM 2262]
MSMPWPRWPLLLASLVAGPSLAAGGRLASVSPTTLLQLRAREPSRAAESLSLLKAQSGQLGLSGRDEFRMSSVQTDSFGLTHTRFQQLHEGIPVWGAVAITHLDPSGRGLTVTKEGVRPHIRVSTRPVVDAASAAALALLEVRPLGLPTKQPGTQLVIYPEVKRVGPPVGKRRLRLNAEDIQEEVVGYRLAWHVHTVLDNTQDGVKQTDFLLDARTGRVLKRWNSLQTASAVGTGRSQYSGDVKLDVFQKADGSYELRDTTRTYGEGLRTYDVNHADIYNGEKPSPVLYQDKDNLWGDGQNFDPSADTLSENGQTAAVDAHFGLQATWDYYQKIHNRFGIDNAGTPTFNYVHVGAGMDNAFWDGDCFCMNYGDGTYPEPYGFKSVVSLDVAGHELSHGVMSQTAALIYSGEPGGLNEANSDIFGTMTEFWVRGGQGDTIGDTGGDWTIGEQLSDSPLRYMYKPSLDGASEDAWSPGLDAIDVHYSSGPMNRAFFFLSQGAQSAATPNDYSSRYLPDGMTGIGNDKAAAIWYRAITAYLTPASNYVAARTASLRAAADLHGSGSQEYRAVQNAFAAINVGYSASTYDDLTPPTATLSLAGSAPMLRFNAVAADNIGVTRVEFYVDGVLTSSDDTQPFALRLDTTQVDPGTHQVVARAIDLAGNAGASAPIGFTVTQSFSQLLHDPGFEKGGEDWVQEPADSDYPIIVYSSTRAHTGYGYAVFNGYGSSAVDRISQQVTLPADTQTAALTFYLTVLTDDLGTQAQDTLAVQVRDTQGNLLEQPASWSNVDSTLGWVQVSLDLTRFAGQTVQLHFVGTENDDGFASLFQLDDLALRVLTRPDTETPFVRAGVATDPESGRVALLGHVWDNGFVNAVELFVDGASQGSVSTTFAKTLSAGALGDGLHALVVKTTDAAGNTSTSDHYPFYVERARGQVVQNPDFELYDPDKNHAEGWTLETPYPESNGVLENFLLAYSGWNLVLFGHDDGPNTSTLRQTVTLPADTESAVYSFWLWVESTAFSDNVAHHTFTAKVRDVNGNDLKTLEVISNLDGTPYYAEHRYDLSEFKGQTIQLFFESNLEEPPEDPINGYTYFVLDDVYLEVSSTPDIQAPSLDARVRGDSGTRVQLSANVSDNTWTAKLEFFVDGTPVATFTDPNGEYTSPFDTSALTNGQHEFMAKATDRAGNGTSVKVPFTVNVVNDTTPPTVSAAVEGEHETTVFTASATDDTGVTVVEFYVDGVFQGRVQEAPYRLPFSTLPLAPGEHTLKAVALDAYGNSASATAPFTRAGPLLSSTRLFVPVDGTYDLSSLLTQGANPLLLWNVQEGRICGTVSSTGVYTAPAAPGLCHVLITHKQDARSSARVDVRVYTADLNGDRVVDGEDLARLAQSWGTRASSTTTADLDASGSVDDSDVTLFLSQFGR